MDRREFVRGLALLAAGAAALPEQVAAFEIYYNVNTPQTLEPLIAVDEIFLYGKATRSLNADIEFLAQGEFGLQLGLNLFGGIVRWVAPPDGKIVTPHFSWKVSSPDDIGNVARSVGGYIRYVDQNMMRHVRRIDVSSSIIRGGVSAT